MRSLLQITGLAAAVLCGLLQPVAAGADSGAAVIDPLAIAAPAPHPPLWKVSDADTVIFMFGTIHALPKDTDWYEEPILSALEGAQELVTEIGEPAPGEVLAALRSRGALPPQAVLRDQLSLDERQSLEAALDTLDTPRNSLDGAKPWLAAVRLVYTALARQGMTKGHGVESFIAARARSLGLPNIALETADYQFERFDSLAPETQRHYLKDVADHIGDIDESLLRIIAAWQAGDADLLARLMNEDEAEPAIANALLYPRNKAWALWIEQRMARPGRVFMAVGAGHLAGQGSVLDELRARGMIIERVQ